MLLADKHNFRQAMKLRLLHIEEKELAYYTQNCYAMGTRSAVLILFSLSGFTQVDSTCLLYTSPSPRDQRGSRMPSSA